MSTTLDDSRMRANPDLAQLLERACEWLEAGAFQQGLDDLTGGLRQLRDSLPWEAWIQVCREAQQHRIQKILLQDPLIARARARPRGYPGDAVTLDYHYQYWDGLLDGVTPVGLELLKHATAHPVSQAVRARRTHVAEVIDRVAERIARPRILSVAAGHVREADASRAIQERRIEELVALDQDRESLALVERLFPGLDVNPHPAKIKELLRGQLQLGTFDLVYSLGLYDYLDASTGRALTRALFDMLRPGGLLLIGNFLREMSAAAHGECILDWWLQLRTADEIRGLAEGLPDEQVASRRGYQDEWRAIGYLEVTRRS